MTAQSQPENVRLGEDGESVVLLDQTRLPGWVEYRTVRDLKEMVEAIRTLRVRGAPAIGVAAAYALCLAAMEYKGQNPEEFQKSMAAASAELAASRPTAVNLFWALDRMGLALGAAGCGAEALPILIREAEAIHREDVAMNRAIAQLSPQPALALIDGNRNTGITVPSRCIVGGDGKCADIAAASVLAKVTRDRYMRRMAETYPQYGFEKHKGYGTAAHYAAIRAYGPCPIHRPSFLKKMH